MNTKKVLPRFESIHNTWVSSLRNYTLEQLQRKPSVEDWSLGQVYVHLIQATLKFQLGHAETCRTTNTNKDGRKNMKGFVSFRVLGGMPPIKIKVPASPQYTPAQPESIEELEKDLARTLDAMKAFENKIETSNAGGKTAHPGFAWLNAQEWFQLIEMHWRHHLRQKKQLDAYLRDNG